MENILTYCTVILSSIYYTTVMLQHTAVTACSSYLPNHLYTSSLFPQLVCYEGGCGLWHYHSDGQAKFPCNVGCSKTCVTAWRQGGREADRGGEEVYGS